VQERERERKRVSAGERERGTCTLMKYVFEHPDADVRVHTT
jgi:hypothetical protein